MIKQTLVLMIQCALNTCKY